MKRFKIAIDAIRVRVKSKLEPADVVQLRRMNLFSRGMELIRRMLIHFSFEPFSFLAEVRSL